ncbi:MAG: InlB B-repeat-containing protein [Erysipelotrichaceae bacterium]|nr:InlB B-repeat-containing protein [Erysipelotrichaceae bacterium]
MKTKLFKILISTAVAVPFSATSILANVNPGLHASQTDSKIGKAQIDLHIAPEKDEPSQTDGSAEKDPGDVYDEIMQIDDDETYPPFVIPDDALDRGFDGVRWYITSDGILYFEGGELSSEIYGYLGLLKRDDNWKKHAASIREIRVVPSLIHRTLILPSDSSHLFDGLSSLTHIDTAHMSTDCIGDMSYMFAHCTSLTSLDLHDFTAFEAEDASYMFCGCSNLEDLDLSNLGPFFVESMAGMFYNCSSLKSLQLSTCKTECLKNAQNMFYNCKNLKSVDLSNFDTSQTEADGCRGMFDNCPSLRKLHLSEDFFKGDMTESCPCGVEEKWMKLDSQPELKSWSDMTKTWKNEDAGWWGIERAIDKLAFNTNGGTEIETLYCFNDESIDLSRYIPSKTGYDFTGWYLDPECQEKAEDQLTLNGDTTLYAGWQIQNRTLTFDTRGGCLINPLTVTFGKTVDLKPFKPIKKGHTFTGWYTDAGRTVKAEDQIVLNEDTTLYAGWKANPPR